MVGLAQNSNSLKNMIYRLFIGSDNKTHRLAIKKILKIVNRYYPGFTSYQVMGYWQGIPEKSLVVEVGTQTVENETIQKLAKELAKELKQEAIGVQMINSEMQFLK